VLQLGFNYAKDDKIYIDWFIVFEESMIYKEYEYSVRKHDLQRIEV
jgi:hypothetical protein